MLLTEGLKSHARIEEFVPSQAAKGGQCDGRETLLARVAERGIEERAPCAAALVTLTDGEFPDVELLAKALCAQETESGTGWEITGRHC